MLGAILSGLGLASAAQKLLGNEFASDEATAQRDWASAEAHHNREFQKQMRETQYQTAVKDMMAAGLNPMLAYHQGGAGTPPGSTVGGAHASTANSGGTEPTSGSQVSVMQAQRDNIEAQTAKTRAEEQEIIARTPTHAVSMDKMRQDMAESVERIHRIIQDTKTSASSAAHLDQQVRNLQATIPQIQASTNQLRALAKLNDAQAIQQLTASGVNEAQAKEILQRVRENLPAVERELMKLEQVSRQMAQPGHQAQEAANASFVGQLGAYLRALNPLQGMIGVIPTPRSAPTTQPDRKAWKAK